MLKKLLKTISRVRDKSIDQIFKTFLRLMIGITFSIWRLIFAVSLLAANPKRASNRKEFALVSSYLPPMWSGGAVIIERLLRDLDPNLYCLISQRSFDDLSNDYIGRLPAKYYKVPDINLYKFMWRGQNWVIEYVSMHLLAMHRAWFIARALVSEGCSILVGTTGEFIGPLADFYAARLAKAELYLYYFDDYVSQWWADSRWVILARKAEIFLAPSVKGFIVPNEYMRDELIKRYRTSSCYIVRNACSSPIVADEKLSFPSSPDEIKILFTGAIYNLNYDAFHALIQAIRNLDLSKLKLHLYTAQPVDLLEKEGINGDCVIFHSHIPPPEAFDAQKQADILVLPFTFKPDALGLVRTSATAKLADYLMTGRPILAIIPADTYIDWYLKHYECGVVVNNDDPVEIANAISRIVEDKELRHRLSLNARARAKIDFDPLDAQKKFLEAIGINSV